MITSATRSPVFFGSFDKITTTGKPSAIDTSARRALVGARSELATGSHSSRIDGCNTPVPNARNASAYGRSSNPPGNVAIRESTNM